MGMQTPWQRVKWGHRQSDQETRAGEETAQEGDESKTVPNT